MKYSKIAYDLQAVMCKELKDLGNTQDLLADIQEGLNKVRMGSHKNRPVGQGNVTYCTYISLMFIYLIRCKNMNDVLNKCGYEEICHLLGPHLQGLINHGKGCHSMIMDMLTYNDTTKDPIFPDLGELVTLLSSHAKPTAEFSKSH